jgi:DNA-binding NarL/FixJ family response regulator
VIRVLVADDEEQARARIVAALSAEHDVEVVGQCADGVQVLSEARRLRPDVVLVDITLPLLGGLEVVRRLAGAPPPVPATVLVAATRDDDGHVRTALRYGASGFLGKDASPLCLVQAVRVAAAGNSLVGPGPAERLVQSLGAAPRPVTRAPTDPLTSRECEVSRLVARGLTNQEIAAELFISLSTVKTHLGNVQVKLGARNRVEIAARAWEADGPLRSGGEEPG